MKVPNDFLDHINDVDKQRRIRHQRDAKLGRLVRVPFYTIFPTFKKNHTGLPTEKREDVVCTVICWVPEDHYLVALPSRIPLTACGTNLGRTATVPCGVCVDA